MAEDKQRLHAIIHGLVQGVSFRYYTTHKANELQLTGWVRNRPDETVEVLAEGSRDKLDVLYTWLHHGPPAARVEKVEATWGEATGEFVGFGTRYWHGREHDDGKDDVQW